MKTTTRTVYDLVIGVGEADTDGIIRGDKSFDDIRTYSNTQRIGRDFTPEHKAYLAYQEELRRQENARRAVEEQQQREFEERESRKAGIFGSNQESHQAGLIGHRRPGVWNTTKQDTPTIPLVFTPPPLSTQATATFNNFTQPGSPLSPGMRLITQAPPPQQVQNTQPVYAQNQPYVSNFNDGIIMIDHGNVIEFELTDDADFGDKIAIWGLRAGETLTVSKDNPKEFVESSIEVGVNVPVVDKAINLGGSTYYSFQAINSYISGDIEAGERYANLSREKAIDTIDIGKDFKGVMNFAGDAGGYIKRNSDDIKEDLSSISIRRTPRESEKIVAEGYGVESNKTSYLNGVEVPYGTKGSTRPDCIAGSCAIEVKNYNLSRDGGESSLINNTANQINYRAGQLPEGMTQELRIDVSGQNVTGEQRYNIIDELTRKTNGILNDGNILFIE